MHSFKKKKELKCLTVNFLFHVFYLKSSGEKKNNSQQFSRTGLFRFYLRGKYIIILVYFQLLFYIRIVLINLDSSVVKILILL